MSVDDRTRLNLHRKLEAVLGQDDADTLMAHLPTTTWADIATKHDLEVLRSELRTDFVEAMNRQIKWMVTFAAAWTTVLLTVAQLLP